MRSKNKTIIGLIILCHIQLHQLFQKAVSGIWLALICVATLSLTSGEAAASNSYYDDGSGVLQNVFQSNGGGTHSTCSSCHTGAATSCSGDGVTQTGFLNYTGARSCYSRIIQKLDGTTNGSQMPLGGAFTSNATYKSRLATWNTAGMPLSPPATPTTLSVIAGITKTSGTLRGTFNPNTLSGGQIRFLWGPTSGTVTTATSAATLNGIANATGTRPLTGLACGNDYFYRAQVRNGGNASYTSAGNTLSFNTSDCTSPVISISSGTNPVLMDEDGSPQDFSLVLQVANDDPGTHTWSISSPASNGTAGASGTGATKSITYSPNLNYTGTDSFTVRATNNTSANNSFVDYVVTVNISPVNDPPVITQGASIGVVMDEDSNPTAFSLTLNATDTDTPESGVDWSISSAASNGLASASGTGYSKVITYTPDPNYNGSDSFIVRAASGTAFDEITVDVTINPRNDAPSINPVGPQAGTEGAMLTITPTVVDPDDANNGTDLTWGFVSVPPAIAADIVISSTGVITWTPPLGTPPPPATFNQMYPITIQVQDDGSHHGMPPDQESFVITINPPDADADMVADYNDYCPGPPNQPIIDSADGSNADNDGDGTFGSDADPNDTVGGDVCDSDDDDDGMPDDFENANSLDKNDPSDAGEDADGDGVTNLQEFLDGTNPNLANLVINATGYLTPYDLVPPEPISIHTQATAVTANDYGPYRPGDNTITWTPSNGMSGDLAASDPGNLVSDPPEQPFFIRPLASVSANQRVEENTAATVTVTVRLNGDAPSWPANPATVNYSVSGTANNPADHNAVAGTLTFVDQDYAEDITLNVFTDAVADPDETIVFTLTGASNAAIGSRKTHTVTIVEANVAPRVDLQFSLDGTVVSSIYPALGASVQVDAMATDANSGQTLSYDWSGTDNALVPPVGTASPSWNPTPAMPLAGNYLVDVVVTDNGVPPRSTRVSRVLNVSALAAPDTLANLADADGDGIPLAFDSIDGTVAGANLVPDQTADMNDSLLLETESGLTLRRGSTSQAAERFGALLSDSDIAAFGSVNGTAPVNATDDFRHVGGIYDFEIHGLIPGTSARIVVPLQSAVPRNGQLRKYHPATGWSDFVVDDNNRVASAVGDLGACPEPGSSTYRSGLRYLDNCIELTIQDGGPNDTDNRANGVISDPASIGVSLSDPEIEEVEEGSGRVSAWLLALLLAIGVLAQRRRRRVI